jgi:hypothetical protein
MTRCTLTIFSLLLFFGEYGGIGIRFQSTVSFTSPSNGSFEIIDTGEFLDDSSGLEKALTN